MKTLKPIPYQSGYIFIDKDITIKGIDPAAYLPFAIAQHNLNLEGIPYLDVDYPDFFNDCDVSEKILLVNMINTHKANKKEFTEEQVRKAMLEMAKVCRENKDLSLKEYLNSVIPTSDKIIQSIRHKIREIEIDDNPLIFERDGKTYIKAKINYEQ